MAERNVSQCQTKIKLLLEKFTQPKVELKSEYCSKFLKHLTDVNGSLLELPVFFDWIMETVTIWYLNKWTPTTNIASFSLNLCGLLSRQEFKFCSMNNNNFYIKLVNIVNARDPNVAPQIQLAYINLVTSLLEHKSGVEWMMACSFWEDILQLSLISQDVYIIRESRNFITKFLERCIEYDERFCNDVVKKIMNPLGESVYRAIKNLTKAESKEEVLYKRLSPTLQLMGTILEYFLENSLFGNKDYRVALIFLEHFQVEKRISDLILVSRNKYLLFDLGRIMFIMQFLDMSSRASTNTINSETIHKQLMNMMNIYKINLSKGNYDNVLKFCYFGIFYWNLMGYKVISPHKVTEAIMFANELIILHVLPFYYLVRKQCHNMKKLDIIYQYDDVRDFYHQKVRYSISMEIVRIALAWRDCLFSEQNLFEICSKSFIYCLKARKFFPRDYAITMFQAFVYGLGDIVELICDNEEKCKIFAKETQFFSLLFEFLFVFIEEFQITWKDSSETFDVLNLTFSFLNISTWCSKTVVKALNVLKISLAKYLAPNLALLIDSTTNSTTGLLGPLLLTKLKDESWEVRSVTLEIVAIISDLAKSEFPSLQKVLIDTNIAEIVVGILRNDGDSFDKVTSIRALKELIQVEEIWDNYLHNQGLLDKMQEIALSEAEGAVRVEALSFLCEAYEERKAIFTEQIVKTLVQASTKDIHWEVRVQALNFYDLVIKKLLQDQGMIDGVFPEVTFSKEHRKIITLTDLEIQRRLKKVLEQLSNNECLYALVSVISNDFDIEVLNRAVKIIQYLTKLLQRHNIFDEESTCLGCKRKQNNLTTVDSESGRDNDVISEDKTSSKNERLLTTDEFICFVRDDFVNIIKTKNNCLKRFQDLRSLIDNMLKSC